MLMLVSLVLAKRHALPDLPALMLAMLTVSHETSETYGVQQRHATSILPCDAGTGHRVAAALTAYLRDDTPVPQTLYTSIGSLVSFVQPPGDAFTHRLRHVAYMRTLNLDVIGQEIEAETDLANTSLADAWNN